MKLSLKQIFAASALVAASASAFADASIPAGYENSSTAPAGDTAQGDNSGVVFHLFDTVNGTSYSLSYNLGLTLDDIVPSEMDEDGLTLTWTIDASSIYTNGIDAATLSWGVVAYDGGSVNADAGSVRTAVTVDANSAETALTNASVNVLADSADEKVTYDNQINDSALDVSMDLYSNGDTFSRIGTELEPGTTWVTSLSSGSTLDMYLYSKSGGRGTGADDANATKYAGVWSFVYDATTGLGTLTYSVQAVPVPAALWLLLSGLGGLGVIGRRRLAAV